MQKPGEPILGPGQISCKDTSSLKTGGFLIRAVPASCQSVRQTPFDWRTLRGCSLTTAEAVGCVCLSVVT